MLKIQFLIALVLSFASHNVAAKITKFSNKDQLDDSASGAVVGEISWRQSSQSDSGIKEPVQDVILRVEDAHGSGYSIRMKFDTTSLLFGTMAKSAREGRAENYAYKLPSGVYKLKDVWIITQVNKYRLPEEISIPFEVYPGKASYFGSVQVDVISKRHMLPGMTSLAGVDISISDNSASFLPALMKNYSNITANNVVVIPNNYPIERGFKSLLIGD